MSDKVLFRSFITLHGGRYFWAASALALLSILLFLLIDSSEPANGGTGLGYVLGITGALIIVWLALFGIRKRSYSSRLGTVKGWLSAHIYLGVALLVIVTLHSAAQVGWNIHTLAYVLMWLVVLSGMFGVWAYRHYPPLLLANRNTRSRQKMLEELSELDRQCSELANQCLPDMQTAVGSAIERTAYSGRWFFGLIGKDRSRMVWPMATQGVEQVVSNADQARIIGFLRARLSHGKGGEETIPLQSLLELFSLRRQAVRSLHRELKIQGFLKIWLFFHIPLSIGLLAALVSHIFAVLIYW